MSFKRLLIIAALAVAAMACKKEKEETLPYLNGGLRFNVPEFVTQSSTVTMTPKGMIHPEEKGIGYKWRVEPTMPKYDTTRLETGLNLDGVESDGSFTFTFTDTLTTCTVTCIAFAEGYNTTSVSKRVTVVKSGPDGSITQNGISAKDPYIDVDGVSYYYTTHGDLTWFRNNLATHGSGASLSNVEVMGELFGKFYSYEEALTACPDGWRLPTDQEWTSLCTSLGAAEPSAPYTDICGVTSKLMVSAYFNGEILWDYWPEVGEITNSSQMSVLPSGYANIGKDGATFEGLTEYATFWTADKVEGEEDMAYYRYIISNRADLIIGKGNTKTFGASVRCVKDAE